VVPLAVPEAGKQRYFYLKNVSVQLTKVEAVKASRQAALALYVTARVHVVICVNEESCRPSFSAFRVIAKDN
jgi:hypothetical protein